MKIGIPKETKQGEGRVAATPELVQQLVGEGSDVFVEESAGVLAGYADELYLAAGAKVTTCASVWAEADLIVKVKEPVGDELDRVREGQTLFCYLHLAAEPQLTRGLLARGTTAIAFETVEMPNGQLPLLEPMSEVAGRLSGMWGCFLLQREQGGKGLLPGGLAAVPRARILIIGGGTVGFHAASVAQGLGAAVTIAELSLDRVRALERLLRDPFDAFLSTPDELAAHAATSDVVIGAALVPGRAAPTLLTEQAVRAMAPGSVICDVAIDQGGCVATSRPTTHAQPTFVAHNVVHQCITNLPGAVPATASSALCNVISPYVLALARMGVEGACKHYPQLEKGINVRRGEPYHEAVRDALDLA